MNQIVVILIVLKNWLINLKPSLKKIFLTCIGLVFSIELYHIYNEIPYQEIAVDIYSPCKYDLYAIDFFLNYGSSEKKSVHFKDTLIENKSFINFAYLTYRQDTTYSRSYVENLTKRIWNENNKLYSRPIPYDLKYDEFNESEYCVLFNMRILYRDNTFYNSAIDKTTHFKPKQSSFASENRIESEISYFGPYHKNSYLGRRKWIYSESFLVADTFRTDFPFASEKKLIDVTQAIENPTKLSAYDVTKRTLFININSESQSFQRININCGDYCEFSSITPQPDSVFYTSFYYNDSTKIKYIHDHGITANINFPKNESLQQTRNYVISAFITLFLTFLCTYIWKCLVIVYNKRIKQKKVLSSLRNSDHLILASSLIKQRLLSNIIIGIAISSIICLIDLYNYSWLERFLLYSFLCGFIPYMRYLQQCKIYQTIPDKTIKKNAIVLCLLGFVIVAFVSNKLFEISIFGTILMLLPSILFIIIMRRLIQKKKK